MICKEELEEIRKLLEKSQNPIFFFDNDLDGLMSFLILAKYIGRGKGIAVRSYPDINVTYTKKIDELKPDAIFIIDKPLVSEGFFAHARQLNIPIVWIDHHPLSQEIKNIHYFNPINGKPSTNEPVAYWCWKIAKEKEDSLWLAMAGCVSDWFIPDFKNKFLVKYPDLIDNDTHVGHILYKTRFGTLIRILDFGLKDRTTNVLKMMKAIQGAKSPYEVFDDSKFIETRKRYNQIDRKYSQLVEKAKEQSSGKLIFFQYGGDLSLSGEISNALQYNFPDKIIVVAYIKGEKVNISMRGQQVDIRKIAAIAMKDIQGTSGGHEHAAGASIGVEDLPKFKENIEEQLE